MAHASHLPSPAPVDESHAAWFEPWHAAPTLPTAHAMGEHVVRSGMVDSLVTRAVSGMPPFLTPLLKSAQYLRVRRAGSGESKRIGGSKICSTGSLYSAL